MNICAHLKTVDDIPAPFNRHEKRKPQRALSQEIVFALLAFFILVELEGVN